MKPLRSLLVIIILLSSLNLFPTVNADTNVNYNAFDAELDTVKGELTLTRWGDTQVKVSVPYQQPSSSSISAGKTDLNYADYKCQVYETSHGLEWDIVLAERPLTNSFSLKVDSSLAWWYQPTLTEEYNQKDCEVWTSTYVKLKTGQEFYRPENVTGSYAVYGSGWGNQYKTGKFMHVYRPKIYDSKGGWVWGELSYNVGVLTIIVPQGFLDTAIYPVTIDPSFGYATQGGSNTGFGAAAVFAGEHTLGVDATVTQIGIYCSDSSPANSKAAIYDHEAGDNTPENLDGTTSETNVGGVAWYIFDFNPDIPESAGTYWLAGFASDGSYKIYYDAAGSSEWYSKAYNGFDDPWSDGSSSSGTFKWSIYANYTVGGANNAPTNDFANITNLDQGDNLYAQKRDYIIEYRGHDDDGFQDIDYVFLNLTQGALIRASFLYDNATDNFSIVTGDGEFDIVALSCWSSKLGDDLNLSIYFRVEWDALEEDDVELYAEIFDDEPASDSDQFLYSIDIFTDLTTTFSINDDRGNIGQSITASGIVTYDDGVGGVYPPDAEFTSVSVYDSANNNEGTDNTINDGNWAVTFNAPGTVGIDTYNLYIDMADADYVDGEEAPSDTFITDRIMVYYEALNDSRVNINANIEGRYRAVLDYDESAVGVGDQLNLTWGPLTWDAVNAWFDITHTEATVTGVTASGYSGYEATFAITSTADNITETTYIYDRIMVYYEALNDSRVDINVNIEGRYRAVLDYDESALGAGDELNMTWGPLAWDAGNNWFEILHTEAAATGQTVGGWAGNETNHIITAIAENLTETTWIWDSLVVSLTDPPDQRVDVNYNISGQVVASAIYDYDSAAYAGTFTLNYSTWVHAVVGKHGYTVSAANGDDAYGITAIRVNDETYCIWDRVNITVLAVVDNRINAGATATVNPTAVYEYDAGAWAGVITYNASLTQAAVGLYGYSVQSITDTNYGLTAFTQFAPDFYVIFDRIRVLTLMANGTTVAVGTNVLLNATLELEYDNHGLGAGDTVNLTASVTPPMTWNAGLSVFEEMETRGIDATVNYNLITASEATYGITVVNMNGNAVTVVWGAPGNLLILVIDGYGEALVGAYIAVWNQSGMLAYTGETNDTGYLNLGAVANGNYSIQAQQPSFQSLMGDYVVAIPQLITMSLQSIEDGIMFNLELLIFVALGSACLYIGYTTAALGNKIGAYFMSCLFWVSSMYQWIVSNPNSYGLILAFFAPFIWGASQGMHALGAYVDRIGSKRNYLE